MNVAMIAVLVVKNFVGGRALLNNIFITIPHSMTSIHHPHRRNNYIVVKSMNECEGEQLRTVTRNDFLRNTVKFSACSTLMTIATIDVNDAVAAEDSEAVKSIRKPYAPLENLLPATRVRVYIDKLIKTTYELTQLPKEDISSKKVLIEKLQESLLTEREFLKSQERSNSTLYLKQKTLDDWNKARQQEATRKEFPTKNDNNVNPLTQANEAFVQWGEKDQFKRLRRQQRALENSNTIRAAFNTYTNNLKFGESYTLTASKEEKARLIRNDQLPDVTSVIRSDLDLRDLYRNQILTTMDDAKAEFNYQLRRVQDGGEEAFDGMELLALLKEEQISCNKWFEFIPASDVLDALQVVLTEE